MAIKVYNGTNFDGCLGTQTIAATNNSISTTLMYGATFTAPNTTNAVTGCVFYLAAALSSGDIHIELQESSVQKAVAIANFADLQVGFNYVRFTTPYVFTTTSAGAYRFGIKKVTGTGSVARDAGGSLSMLFATTDQTGAVGASDDVMVMGAHDSGLTPLTLPITGTAASWGSGTDRAMSTSTNRTIGAALTIGNGGTVQWDTSASSKLTLLGSVFVTRGGLLDMRAHASDLSRVTTLEINNDVSSGQFGIHSASSLFGGQLLCEGATVVTHAQFASGVGTAANPVVTTAAHGFAVGDELVFGGSSSYQNNEIRFVISTPAANQLVLSTTAGGSEVALAQTHAANSYIGNLTRNCVIKGTNTARGPWIMNMPQVTTPLSSFNYCRAEYANCASGKGIYFNGGSSNTVNGNDATFDGFVLYNNDTTGRNSISVAGKQPYSISNVILFNTKGSNYAGQSGMVIGGSKKAIDTLLHFAEPSSTNCCAALSLSSAVNNQITNLHSYGANAGGGALGYAIGEFNSANNSFRDCSVNGARVRGVLFSNSQFESYADCSFGTIASNTIDIDVTSETFNVATFSQSSFGSATLLGNYLNGLAGSDFSFHEMDGNADKHRFYGNTGSGWSAGAGLTNTTVRTPDSLSLMLRPEDATDGFAWETLVPAVPAAQCGVFGYCYRNATFSAGTFKVELFLPGSTVADASYTFATTTEAWLPFNISAYYSGTESRYATVRITAITATAGAYAFIDDLYDAGTGNKVAGLDLWHEGKPSQVMVAADFSAIPALVWGYSNSGTSAATMGQELVDKLDTSGYTAPPTAAAIETEVLDSANGVETGLTVRNALRVLAAALGGELSGADTTTITIRNAVADSKDRIVATVDASGNRTGITYDLSD